MKNVILLTIPWIWILTVLLPSRTIAEECLHFKETCHSITNQSTVSERIIPFYSRNQSPFIHIFGLPAIESGVLIPPDKIETRMLVEVINNYSRDRRSQQRIVLDGETYYTLFSLRWGISNRFEMGIDVPYMTHNKGVLDNFIEDWHRIFSFSNKERQEMDRNQLNYLFEGKKKPFHVHRHQTGMGDLLLNAAVSLSNRKRKHFHFAALRMGWKLPTGDPDTLHGSGNSDFYLSINAQDTMMEKAFPLAIYGGAGLLITGKSKILPVEQRHHIGFGSIGAGKSIWEWLDLKAQIDAHTAFYKNDSQQLGVFSAQLVMGGTVHLPYQIQSDLGISEDIIKDTAPDLIFHLALRRQF